MRKQAVVVGVAFAGGIAVAVTLGVGCTYGAPGVALRLPLPR